jgi:parallel beta-helix repeat protein
VGNNSLGITLHGSTNNTLSGNTVGNNSWAGISLEWESSNNIVSGNTVENNSYGIYLPYYSDNNTIFHNYLFNNAVNNAYDNGNNYWDNGSAGNYWGDYVGTDNNGDGIGEAPYLIPGGPNQDNYPLVNQENYVPGEVIVGFHNTSKSGAIALIESYGLEWEHVFLSSELWNYFVVTVPVGQEQQWIETFENENIVEFAQLNHIISIDLPPY